MAKLVLLLVFVCFQFSSQEELGQAENELALPAIITNTSGWLDGEDKNQWPPNTEEEKGVVYHKKWTPEDEKWLQQIQQLLEESGEDYGNMSSDEFDKLMEELDKYFGESEESDENWDIDLSHYPDYFEQQQENEISKDEPNPYYAWLDKLQLLANSNNRRQPVKRFTSV